MYIDEIATELDALGYKVRVRETSMRTVYRFDLEGLSFSVTGRPLKEERKRIVRFQTILSDRRYSLDDINNASNESSLARVYRSTVSQDHDMWIEFTVLSLGDSYCDLEKVIEQVKNDISAIKYALDT